MFTRVSQNVLGYPLPDGSVLCDYSDVSVNSWYFSSVEFVTQSGLMNGTGDVFSPNTYLSRAMVATILWRISGSPKAAYTERFSDVPPNQWYSDAVVWAESVGVVNGYGSGIFGANDAATREQLAAMLFRYAKFSGLPANETGDLSVFYDRDKISSYAYDAISWAVGVGIINGVSFEADPTDAVLSFTGGVSVIGDSVMLGAEQKMKAAFADLQFDAKVSRGMKAGVSLITDSLGSGVLKENIVIALGTNYNYDAEEELEKLLLLLAGKGKRVVLVTPFCNNGSGNDKHVPLFAEFERGLPSEYPFVEVADWNAFVQTRPNLLAGDKVHLSAAGKEEYTMLVMRALIAVQKKGAS
jgi:hypothetical protein